MLCGSGLKAIAMGYQSIRCGDAKVLVCGGQESMSKVCKNLALIFVLFWKFYKLTKF